MATATQPRTLSSSTITGDAVKNHQGESLGEIKDLVIDLESGKVSYAVLDFGGFLGIGNKLFAVPWKALSQCSKEKCFLLDTDKERLEKQEGFDQNNWPDMADRSWGERIHANYQVDAYWKQ